MIINNLYFVMTCGACPEQYDVYSDESMTEQVGYIRLRHGNLFAESPDCLTNVVFHHCFDDLRGSFYSDDVERMFWLKKCAENIQKALDKDVKS